MSKRMTKSELLEMSSLGALKPVGYAVLAFKDETVAGEARKSLLGAGFADEDLLGLSSSELFPNLDDMMRTASSAAGFGYEVVLMRRYMTLASEGVRWLVVHCSDDRQTGRVKDVAARLEARSAVHYGHLMHEDLV